MDDLSLPFNSGRIYLVAEGQKVIFSSKVGAAKSFMVSGVASQNYVNALRLVISISPSTPDGSLFQLPDSLLKELTFWLLLGKGQSLLIRGPSRSGAAQPAVHIRAR